jgi:hypothetical protein
MVGGVGAVAAAAGEVPVGFVPCSTSWTSATAGWVLGFVPEKSDEAEPAQHPVLLQTETAGLSWQQVPAPPVGLPPTGEQVRVFFANPTDGLITDGSRLFATYDAGVQWQPVVLPGAVGPVAVGAIDSNLRFVYVIVSSGTDAAPWTALYSSPVHRSAWAAAKGVAVPGRGVPAGGGWDVAARGASAQVALGVVFESSRYWVAADGQTWREHPAPGPIEARVDLDSVPSGDVEVPDGVFALVSSNPGRGFMTKEMLSTLDGRPFESRGPAPDAGITTGFAAGGPAVAAVGAVGAGASYLHSTVDSGQSWQTTLTLTPDVPLYDLAFTDTRHATMLAGGPGWPEAAVYRSTDAGRTWARLALS